LGAKGDDQNVTIPLVWEAAPGKEWLSRRINQMGQQGQPVQSTTDVAMLRVPRGLKAGLREWLTDRAGLSQEVIYPTPWHRPYLEEFCRAHGRNRPLPTPLG
jgi:hypothetical protein